MIERAGLLLLTNAMIREKAMVFPTAVSVLAMVGACFASVTSASELAPAEIVANYLRLVTTKSDQAKVMLAPDAAYIMFDLGGSMAEHFPEFMKQLSKSDCANPILQTEGKAASDTGVDAEVIKAEWRCAKPTEEMPASTTIRFFVGKQKILGALFEDPPGYQASFPPF